MDEASTLCLDRNRLAPSSFSVEEAFESFSVGTRPLSSVSS